MTPLFQHKSKQKCTLQCDGFEVEIVRTNRKKSASIKVKEGHVSVSVPKQVLLSDIDALVNNKTSWIKKQLLLQLEAITLSKRGYREGEKIYYRGNPLTLTIQTGQRALAAINDEQLIISVTKETQSAENIKRVISSYFEALAEQALKERTLYYAKKIGASYTSIRVKHYKSRWGSCSVNGLISYNWRIIIAPDPIIDYIVVHELCHLIEHNHSARFWEIVERFSPDYKQHRAWLRKNGLLLTV